MAALNNLLERDVPVVGEHPEHSEHSEHPCAVADCARPRMRSSDFCAVHGLAGVRPDEPDDRPYITLREREVLVLMANGMSNKEIAARLRMHETTVKTHVKHLLAKTWSTSRAGAVARAIRSGVIT